MERRGSCSGDGEREEENREKEEEKRMVWCEAWHTGVTVLG